MSAQVFEVAFLVETGLRMFFLAGAYSGEGASLVDTSSLSGSSLGAEVTLVISIIFSSGLFTPVALARFSL
jgi:hypothetical protein